MATSEIDEIRPTIKNYMFVLNWLVKHQLAVNSMPRERELNLFEKLHEFEKNKEGFKTAAEFWRPVMALRARMAGVWQKFHYGDRPHPCAGAVFLVRDFRLDITDEDWEETRVISHNHCTKDCIIIEHPARPTTLDYLFGKYDETGPFAETARIKNMMIDKSKVIDEADEEQLIRAKRRAKAESDGMRDELRSDPEKYIERAAIISATNGYVNKAVMDYLNALNRSPIRARAIEKSL
jgi:hypothetical protein